MTEFEAKKMIEAFRSGVPTKDIGYYFSSARRNILNHIKSDLEEVTATGVGGSCIIGGRYGEGKTHMLNTIKGFAEQQKMVYSYLSLGKETPMHNIPNLFKRVCENLYLPDIGNPGFFREIENKITLNNELGKEALDFARNSLATDRLYYVFRAYLGSKDSDDRFLLQSDLEGSFIGGSVVKSLYAKAFGEKVTFKEKFVKSKNIGDYFAFISFLIKLLGYNGWVILFDESELIGRFAYKTRMKAYLSMHSFLFPKNTLLGTYSVFAFSSSYIDEVINSKDDKGYINASDFDNESKKKILKVIDSIISLKELTPLTDAEFSDLIKAIVSLYEKAYAWHSNESMEEIMKVAKQSGFLLRTRIRAALEYLDQLFLYGNYEKIAVGSLNSGSYDEDVSLDELFSEL